MSVKTIYLLVNQLLHLIQVTILDSPGQVTHLCLENYFPGKTKLQVISHCGLAVQQRWFEFRGVQGGRGEGTQL